MDKPPERSGLARGASPHVASIQVLSRFAIRLAILAVSAALGSHGFGKTFASLLALAMIYCACLAVLRRETPFDAWLTHYDEGSGYAAAWCLASSLG